MLYSTLAEYYARLEETTKRLEMTDILTMLIRDASPDEIEKIVYLTQGKIHPDWTGEPEIGMAEKMVVETLVKVSGLKKEEVEAKLAELGDIGLAAEEAMRSKKQDSFFKKQLTVRDVYNGLDSIARKGGKGSAKQKIDTLASLMADSSPLGARYLARTVVGSLRLGIGDMTILDALSQAYTGSKEARGDLERAYNLSSDLGLVARTLAEEGYEAIHDFHVRVGSPIRVMAAQRLSTAEEVIEKLEGQCSAEYKLDGERFQIHKKGSKVQIFSRRLENITHMYPEVVTMTGDLVRAGEAIIEGEAVAYDPATGDDLPFQALMQRRRKYGIEEMMEKIPVRVYLFDCLYADGVDLTLRPYPERVAVLESIVNQREEFKRVESLRTSDPAEMDRFFQQAIADGTEGVVVKSTGPESIYRAGARSWLWVKLKRSYQSKMQDTVDLVVVGAFHGRGRRAGSYGALLAAAYDQEADLFRTVCKVGSGFTDENLGQIPSTFKSLEIPHRHARVDSLLDAEVWFEPRRVMEVLGDEITASPLHTAAFGEVRIDSGLAIRFPRFTQWREDKSAEEATTVQEILGMYKSQLKTMNEKE
jgi:DNA ligase 1